MIKVDVDDAKAKSILEKAFRDASRLAINENQNSSNSFSLDFFVRDLNKTYLYILCTALLAKSTDKRVNPIVIQKKSSLDGAYDARSLCHSVIVKNKNVNKLLGNSNEPFLNKPARIESLDKQTAFRGGKTKKLIKSLIRFLLSIKDETEAYTNLVELLCLLIKQHSKESIKYDMISKTIMSASKNIDETSKVYKVILNAQKHSLGGQTLAISVGAILKCFYEKQPEYSVVIHNVNESGASSKEIEDIDVFFKGKPLYCVELKDKEFDENDILNSVRKVSQSFCYRLIFIVGVNSREKRLDRFSVLKEKLNDENFNLEIIDFDSFFNTILNLIPLNHFSTVYNFGLVIMKEINSSKEMVEWWNKIFSGN